VFSAEFKAVAVRLMTERRAAGISLAQAGRELAVHPSQLRAWAKAQPAAGTPGGVVPSETLEQKNRWLSAFAPCCVGRWSPPHRTSRKRRVEVRRDRSPSRRKIPFDSCGGACRSRGRLLRVSPAAGVLEGGHGRRVDGAGAGHVHRQ
jgi:transposase-like protein